MKRSCMVPVLALLTTTSPAQQGWPESMLFGCVVDALHEAVPVADVWVTDEHGEVVARTVADGSGIYQLRRLPFGQLFVHAKAEGKVQRGVEVGSRGRRRQATLRLDDGRAVAGVVRWPDGSPVVGADVLVREVGLQSRCLAWSQETTTDEAGRWRVDAAPLRRVAVVVFQPGFGIVTVQLENDVAAPVAIELPKTAVEQRVVEVRGIEKGRAARVFYAPKRSAYGDYAISLPRRAREAAVGDDGIARIWPVPSREELRADAAGMSSLPVVIRLSPRSQQRLRFEMQPLPEKVVTSRTVMHGKVVDELGRPLAGVPVVSLFEGRRSAPVPSGDDGTFCIEVPIYPGVLVDVGVLSSERYLGIPKTRLGGDGVCWLSVTSSADQPLRLDTAAAGRLRGTLRTPNGGYLAAANVVLARSGATAGSVVTAADAGGRIELSGLPPGDYRITATGSDGRIGRASVRVVAGQTVEPEPLAFDPGAALSGVVFDDDGAPAALAELVVMPPFDRRRRQRPGQTYRVTSGADGRYRLPFVAAGEYVVVSTSLQARVRMQGVATVEIEDGKPVVFDVRSPE